MACMQRTETVKCIGEDKFSLWIWQSYILQIEIANTAKPWVLQTPLRPEKVSVLSDYPYLTS